MKTFDELVDELAQVIENPAEGFVPKGLEKQIAESLNGLEGYADFLKATLSSDMRRYFAASKEEQDRIKGAFSRTVYFLGLARSGGNLKEE